MIKRLFTPTGLTVAVGIAMVIAVSFIAGHTSGKNSDKQTEIPAANANSQEKVPPAQVKVGTLGAEEGDKAGDGSADYLLPLGKSLASYIDKHDSGSSLYIEDLTTKHTISVGETKAYNVKSLMKVPLVMSMYKAASQGKLDLDKELTIRPSQIDKNYGDLWKRGAGATVTLREAGNFALQKSDNTAIKIINDRVFKVMPDAERAYLAIDMDIRADERGDSYVSTSSYSTVFRCLLNACYNDRQDSDTILGLLKNSDFKAPNKLLPAGTEVAHKIGTSNSTRDGKGFNDCGVVYGPQSPFIFCMMLTVGRPQADDDVANLIKQSYDFLEAQPGKQAKPESAPATTP